MAQWQKIKTEYITTDISYRKLAQKYGLNYNSVADKGKAEGWVELRNQFRVKTQSEIMDVISGQEVDRAKRFQNVADKLLTKIEAIVDTVEPKEMPAKSIRALTAAVKDLKEIQMIRSDADMREQEARIAKLQKEAQKQDGEKSSITITLEGGLSDYAQ